MTEVLVTGATGYIGSHLVPRLLDAGYAVRVLSRNPDRLPGEWRDRVQVEKGDAADDADVRKALEGVDVLYYLLHSMDGKGDFVARDRALAERFASMAARGRRHADRLPLRAASDRRTVPAPGVPGRGRRDPARLGCADGDPAGRGGTRGRLGVLRHAPPSHRAAARDGGAEMAG